MTRSGCCISVSSHQLLAENNIIASQWCNTVAFRTPAAVTADLYMMGAVRFCDADHQHICHVRTIVEIETT